MAFLNKLRSLPLPPVKNVLNVAMQTARQTMPEKPKKSDYEEPAPSSNHGGTSGPPPAVPPRPQSVRFADQQGMINFTQTHTHQRDNYCLIKIGFLARLSY